MHDPLLYGSIVPMFSRNLSLSNLRAVLFDFDGTLRFNHPLAHHFFFDHAVSLGAVDSKENRRAATRWAHRYWNGKGEVVEDTETHGFDTDDFWLNYSRKSLLAFNCPPEQSELLAPHLRHHMHEHYEPVNMVEPDTPGVLRELRRAGLVLGVVSNRDEPYDELLDSLGLSDHFDFALAAGEVNSWKPDPLIFKHALDLAGVSAAETLYVGDNYYADVIGARSAGLEPILIDPEDIFPEADCPVIRSISDLRSLFG